MDIADSVTRNPTLLRLGVHFNTLGPRATVQDTLKKNWDQRKQFNTIIYIYVSLSLIEFFFINQVRLKRVNKDN